MPDEYSSFKLLFNTIRANHPSKLLEQFSFCVAGESNEHKLSDPFLLSLIKSAISQYYVDFPEEFELDILQSEIKNLNPPGSFALKTTGKFNIPSEASTSIETWGYFFRN